MTSQINFSGIDSEYPVAGKDNDSQGFRDNFSLIKTGLATAKDEITTLQSNAVLTASLDDNAVVVNNLNQSVIDNGVYNRFYGTAYVTTVTQSTQDIDLTKGILQVFKITKNTIFTFKNWPAEGKYACARFHVWASDSNTVSITGANSSGRVITVPSTANLLAGYSISGPGISAGSFIVSVDTATSFTISSTPSPALSSTNVTASGPWTAKFVSELGGVIQYSDNFPSSKKENTQTSPVVEIKPQGGANPADLHYAFEAWTWTGSSDRKIYIRPLGTYTSAPPNVSPIPTFPVYRDDEKVNVDYVARVGMVIFNITSGKLEVCTSTTPNVLPGGRPTVVWEPMN